MANAVDFPATMSGEATQQSYNAAFAELARRLRTDGREVRLEDPPQAYLHVSKPSWRDENMNGIHLETCVARQPVAHDAAPGESQRLRCCAVRSCRCAPSDGRHGGRRCMRAATWPRQHREACAVAGAQ